MLEMVEEQIPDRPDGDHILIVGPSDLLQQTIRGAVCAALATLAKRVDDGPAGDAEAAAALVELANVASAWTMLYVDAQAVQGYSFDPDSDPATP
jgi:hypothetical protein